jgi:hypothetical protein
MLFFFGSEAELGWFKITFGAFHLVELLDCILVVMVPESSLFVGHFSVMWLEWTAGLSFSKFLK